MVKEVTIRQNTFREIFEESLSVKISPHQKFALYSIIISLPSESVNGLREWGSPSTSGSRLVPL